MERCREGSHVGAIWTSHDRITMDTNRDTTRLGWVAGVGHDAPPLAHDLPRLTSGGARGPRTDRAAERGVALSLLAGFVNTTRQSQAVPGALGIPRNTHYSDEMARPARDFEYSDGSGSVKLLIAIVRMNPNPP